ncbi:MAG TPA: 2-oxoacid:acceptor oxidoreductase family protein [Acidimicrobiales bacterium]|jgi:2-oxoglutarate ferredoxin oxidoreductase subunit gamma|nr:2-oxoacid:acceptor oxidoreductase family protein [Acidimicrobiales bacterium]
MQTEVMLTGIGGQGIQLCAKTLAIGATDEGRQAMLSAHYGGEMRGGQTEASVVVGDGPLRALPILPSTWSAFVMHPKYWEPVRARLRPDGVVVANGTLVDDDLAADGRLVVAIAAGDIAAELQAPMSAGLVLLGAYSAVTGLVGLEALVAAMKRLVPPYRTQHIVANEAALRAGFDAAPALAAPAWAEVATP